MVVDENFVETVFFRCLKNRLDIYQKVFGKNYAK